LPGQWNEENRAESAHALGIGMVHALSISSKQGADTMRVAIIDNDKSLLRSLGIIMGRRGYMVDCFAGPDDFLAALDRGAAPDIVFVDLVMPGMTGIELLADANTRLPATCRKAIITGHAENLSEDDLAEADVQALFSKPLDLAALAAFLEHTGDEGSRTEETGGSNHDQNP
jgi:DNA-binding NtrC family response regulator